MAENKFYQFGENCVDGEDKFSNESWFDNPTRLVGNQAGTVADRKVVNTPQVQTTKAIVALAQLIADTLKEDADPDASLSTLTDQLKRTIKASTTPTGSIIQMAAMTSSAIAPSGYIEANRQILSKEDYSNLYTWAQRNTVMVSEYSWRNNNVGSYADNVGDASHFRVPNLNGCFVRSGTTHQETYGKKYTDGVNGDTPISISFNNTEINTTVTIDAYYFAHNTDTVVEGKQIAFWHISSLPADFDGETPVGGTMSYGNFTRIGKMPLSSFPGSDGNGGYAQPFFCSDSHFNARDLNGTTSSFLIGGEETVPVHTNMRTFIKI